jgi:Phosphotransferase enzyme family
LAAAEDVGLRGCSPTILKDANNTIVDLGEHGVVAKVGTSTLPGRAGAIETGLGILQHLAANGGPSVRPVSRVPLGPHAARGCVVILLDRLDHDGRAPIPPGVVAATLGELHAALSTYPHTLPRFDAQFDDVRMLLLDRSRTPSLGETDRAFLLDVHRLLTRRLADRSVTLCQPLHGDPWEGNLVRTPAGALLLDLEASCLGPREWDFSAVSDEAAAVAGVLDPA